MHWRKQMKSTAKLCRTIKKRKQERKEMWQWRFISLAGILLILTFITMDAIPGFIACGIIATILITDADIRRRF